MIPKHPQRVGRFVVEGELGRGAWGEVLAARDPRLDRRVALKRLPADVAGDPRRRELAEAEARLLAAVNHPNVATLYGLEDDSDGAPHLVMELVPGVTLLERLAESPLALTVALDVALQLAEGLEAAHAAGVVHGDLKPANVKLTPIGRVKILDFGVARRQQASATDIEGPTESGHESGGDGSAQDAPGETGVSGSPGYMAPEQLAGAPADERTDCWSFGCVVFECLSGKRALPGRTLTDVLTATLHGEPAWSALPDDTPAELRALLRNCLSPDPAVRPAGLAAVRDTLERLRESAGATPAPPPSIRRLPAPTTSFVGRAAELRDVQELLAEARLVTLTGVGGSGKSRLALEAARQREAADAPAVHLVELAALADGRLVDSQALSALGLAEEPDATARELLVRALSAGAHLLVLDNCEHLLAACASLCSELLASCPELTVLTTSRETLGLAGEHVLVVPPLANVADDEEPEALAKVDSVLLFLDRARAARRRFGLTSENATAVASIVRRLDGLPLGLELAAARLRTLSVEQLDEQLRESYGVLTGSARAELPRHRTMEAAIEWSHARLTEKERVLYRRLSVFAGGWMLDLAEPVCAGDGLDESEAADLVASLVDKSLVVVDESPVGTRYRYLEPVRQHARGKLVEADEADAVLRRHLDALKAFMNLGQLKQSGPEAPAWLARQEQEHGNVRVALAHEGSMGDSTPKRLYLAGFLAWFWLSSGRLAEGRRILGELLARKEGEGRTGARLCALGALGIVSQAQGDYSAAWEPCAEALAIAREVDRPDQVAAKATNLGVVAVRMGKLDDAERLLEEALALHRASGDEAHVGGALLNLGLAASNQGRLQRAKEHWSEAVPILKAHGNREWLASALHNLAMLDAEAGDFAEARRSLEEALNLRRELGHRTDLAMALLGFAELSSKEGNSSESRSHYEECLALAHEVGDSSVQARCLKGLANMSLDAGDLEGARAALRDGLALQGGSGDASGLLGLLLVAVRVFAAMGRPSDAGRLLGAVESSGSPLLGWKLAASRASAKAEVRAALSEEAYERALTKGRQLSVDEACEFALNALHGQRQTRPRDTTP